MQLDATKRTHVHVNGEATETAAATLAQLVSALGFAEGAVATGRLMPESERLVAHFQRLVVDALRG